MKKFDVIVLNSHGVGQVCYIKRLPVLGETLRAWNWHVEEDGGKGTTVAVALGRLGIQAAYIGKVGRDLWGDLGFKWMGDAGVDTTFMYQSDEVSTGTGLIMIDEQGRNTIVDGDSSLEALTEEEIKNALDAMKESTYFSTGFGMPEKKALYGARYAKSLGMKTILNASPLPDHEMGDLSYIDYLVINEVEGKALADLPNDTHENYETVIKLVKAIHNCKTVVMTLGDEGCMILNDELISLPGIKVKVVDTTGAGDSYLAAFVAGLVWGKSLREAGEFAIQCSALKVTRQGTIPAFPTLKDAQAFIAESK